jgi:hypothetical protein
MYHLQTYLVYCDCFSEDYPYKEVLDLMANRCLADRTNAWTDTGDTYLFDAYSSVCTGAVYTVYLLPYTGNLKRVSTMGMFHLEKSLVVTRNRSMSDKTGALTNAGDSYLSDALCTGNHAIHISSLAIEI